MSNYHPWRIALIVTPMFFVAGFLAVLGMKLANQLVAGDAFNQSLSLHQLNRDNFFTAQGEATITSVQSIPAKRPLLASRRFTAVMRST